MSEKKRIVENFSVISNSYKRLPLQESVIEVTEKATGDTKQYKAKAVYTFPISRPDKENLNGRIYTSKLWEKVIKEKQAEGSFGLMDHPEEEGSTKDCFCVWRNLRFSEDKKFILCDAYLFGRWGQDVLEALEAGGKIGLSTSGFGEFEDDDKTLNPETYMLERVADFVFNPSYEVFGEQKDLVESVKENVNTLEISPNEDNVEEIVMEKDTKKTSPSLEEKSLLLNLRNMFKEAKKHENVFERLESYKDLKTYFVENMEDGGLRAQIEEAEKNDNESIIKAVAEAASLKAEVESLKSELNESKAHFEENEGKLTESANKVAELEKQLEESKTELESVKKELKNSCDLLDSFKEYSRKQKSIHRNTLAEMNTMVSVKDYKESIVYAEDLENQISKLKAELLEAKKKAEGGKETKKVEEPANDDAEDVEDENDEEETDSEEKGAEEKKPAKKKESVNREVLDYYNDLEYRNPSVVLIKEDILSKRTLMEAQRTYLRLKGLVETTAHERRLSHTGSEAYAEPRRKNLLREGWV